MDIKIFELEKLYIRALNDIIEVKVKKTIKNLMTKLKNLKNINLLIFLDKNFMRKNWLLMKIILIKKIFTTLIFFRM